MTPEKGQYHSIYSAIWDDPEFQSFSPTTQTVFFCLRISRECNFPCIYPHYHSTLYERLPKANPADIDSAVKKLIAADWIRYERPILWIVKGLKNAPTFAPRNTKQILGIANILKSLPKLQIVDDFASFYGIPYGPDAVMPTVTDTPSDAPSDTPTDAPTDTPPKQVDKEVKKEKKKKEEAKPFILPPEIQPDVWAAFEEHRKKLRKPMTDHARDLIVQECAKLGGDPNLLLDQSIRKGWMDVFPLKDAAPLPASISALIGEPAKPEHLCVAEGCTKIGVTGRGKRMYCREHNPDRAEGPF